MKMERRSFIRSLFGIASASVAAAGIPRVPGIIPNAGRRRLRIQESSVAGFQYHEGDRVWARLCVGDALELVREPENRFDEWAVSVEWNGRKLGYVPRDENAAVAQMLDRGETLTARITELTASENPWERIQFEVEAG
jgi:hypothetical protein